MKVTIWTEEGAPDLRVFMCWNEGRAGVVSAALAIAVISTTAAPDHAAAQWDDDEVSDRGGRMALLVAWPTAIYRGIQCEPMRRAPGGYARPCTLYALDPATGEDLVLHFEYEFSHTFFGKGFKWGKHNGRVEPGKTSKQALDILLGAIGIGDTLWTMKSGGALRPTPAPPEGPTFSTLPDGRKPLVVFHKDQWFRVTFVRLHAPSPKTSNRLDPSDLIAASENAGSDLHEVNTARRTYLRSNELLVLKLERSWHSDSSHGGFGLIMGESEDDFVQVLRVYDGSPAERAGLAKDDIVFKIGGRTTYGWSGKEAVKQLSSDYTHEQVTLLSFYRPSENKKYEQKVTAGPYDLNLSDRHMEGSVLAYRSHDGQVSVLHHPYGKKWVPLRAGKSASAFNRINGIEMQIDIGLPKEKSGAAIPINYAFRLR